jgi:hypothetical protein
MPKVTKVINGLYPLKTHYSAKASLRAHRSTIP